MRNLRTLLILAAAGIAVTSLAKLAQNKMQNRTLSTKRRRGRPTEGDFDQLHDQVDDTVDDSFPASDPPSWNAPQKDHLH
jgi:hypothetical protein